MSESPIERHIREAEEWLSIAVANSCGYQHLGSSDVIAMANAHANLAAAYAYMPVNVMLQQPVAVTNNE